MTQQEQRSRIRPFRRQTSKVPLTYYRSSDKALESKSPFEKKQASTVSKIRYFLAGLFNLVIILAILAGITYSLLVNPNPKVDSSSATYHPTSVYKNAAQKYLGTFYNRNKITLNESAISQSLQKQFPEIANVSIELPMLAQTLVIHLNISQPSFILYNNSASYIIDTQGVAITRVNQVAALNSSNLASITDSSGFKAKEGKQVMSASSVQFINSLVAQLQHAKIPIKSITLPPLAQELDLQTADRLYSVKFYLGGDVLKQTGQFLATRHQFDATNTQPAEYLDVRVPGKVFYK